MSVISTRHQILPFTAGDKALSGQRLAKLQWKSSKGKAAEFPNQKVSLPVFPDKDILAAVSNGMFLSAVREIVEENQKELIKSLFVESGGLLKEVSDEEISLEAINNYIRAKNSESQTFSKESLNLWFESDIRENLTMALMVKMNIEDEENELIQKTVKVIKAIIMMATDRDFEPQGKQLKAFQNVLAVDTGETWIGKKLASLVAKWESSDSEALLEGL